MSYRKRIINAFHAQDADLCSNPGDILFRHPVKAFQGTQEIHHRGGSLV